DQVAQFDHPLVDTPAHDLPGRRDLILVGLEVGPPRVRQLKGPAPLALLGPNQALVLQLLQRRIDRSRARSPEPTTSLPELLHDLVAVQRLLGEQDQDRRPDVAAPDPRPPPPPW